MFKPNEWLHQETLSPHHCSHVVSWHKEGQSLGFLHCAVSLAFIHVMYWPFDIHWLGGNGRSFNFELRSSNHVCFLLLGGLVSDQISLEFSSPVEISLLFSLSVCTRDWFAMTDALKSRASQRSFLLECWLSVPAGEWQLLFRRLTAKTQKLDISVHKRFPETCHAHSHGNQRVLSDSDYAWRAGT